MCCVVVLALSRFGASVLVQVSLFGTRTRTRTCPYILSISICMILLQYSNLCFACTCTCNCARVHVLYRFYSILFRSIPFCSILFYSLRSCSPLHLIFCMLHPLRFREHQRVMGSPHLYLPLPQVQLIMGKTLVDRLGQEEAGSAMKRIKRGQVQRCIFVSRSFPRRSCNGGTHVGRSDRENLNLGHRN